MTEVNGTALATGVYPGESGIIANREFRPAINASKKVGTEELAVVREGDEITGGHYLNSPTVAEILRSHGMRTAIAGAEGVALLHDRADRSEASEGVNLYAGSTLPESSAKVITGLLGQFPAGELTGTNRDLWTRRAVTGPLWEKEVPAFSLLWLSEPDHSQHETGPGSPTSLAAIKHADQNLAQVLAALDQKGLRDTTDVIVVSDVNTVLVAACTGALARLTCTISASAPALTSARAPRTTCPAATLILRRPSYGFSASCRSISRPGACYARR
jgi:hypothetical protein